MCACMHACISVTQPAAFLLPAVVIYDSVHVWVRQEGEGEGEGREDL